MTNKVFRSIRINSDVRNIDIIEGIVGEVCKDIVQSNVQAGNILVAVLEAVANCIIHGNKRDSLKFVDMKITYDSSEIVFEISDEGAGFDPDLIPDPTSKENIENPNGRGIFLMKRLTDEFTYSLRDKTFVLKFYPYHR